MTYPVKIVKERFDIIMLRLRKDLLRACVYIHPRMLIDAPKCEVETRIDFTKERNIILIKIILTKGEEIEKENKLEAERE